MASGAVGIIRETLKDVYARVVPYFEREILPKLQAGENISIGGAW